MTASFGTIRQRIRGETGDLAGMRWPDSELDTYIQEAQDEFSFAADALAGSYELITDGQGLFRLPDDGIALKNIFYNGAELPLMPWREAVKHQGAAFMTQTGTEALFAVPDFDDWNCFRLIPIPPAGLTFTVNYRRRSVAGITEITDDQALSFYGLAMLWLKDQDARYGTAISEFNLRLARSRRHKVSGGYSGGTFF